MKFSRPECWSGKPFPSPEDLLNPGIELRSPALRADSLPAESQGKPVHYLSWFLYLIYTTKSPLITVDKFCGPNNSEILTEKP